MKALSFKRLMPLFAFFIMLAGARGQDGFEKKWTITDPFFRELISTPYFENDDKEIWGVAKMSYLDKNKIDVILDSCYLALIKINAENGSIISNKVLNPVFLYPVDVDKRNIFVLSPDQKSYIFSPNNWSYGIYNSSNDSLIWKKEYERAKFETIETIFSADSKSIFETHSDRNWYANEFTSDFNSYFSKYDALSGKIITKRTIFREQYTHYKASPDGNYLLVYAMKNDEWTSGKSAVDYLVSPETLEPISTLLTGRIYDEGVYRNSTNMEFIPNQNKLIVTRLQRDNNILYWYDTEKKKLTDSVTTPELIYKINILDKNNILLLNSTKFYDINNTKLIKTIQYNDIFGASGILAVNVNQISVFIKELSNEFCFYTINYKTLSMQDKTNNNTEIYPNPSTQSATVEFELMNDDKVKLEICTMEGKSITALELGYLAKGVQKIEVKTDNIDDGLYIIKIIGQHINSFQKLIVKR